MYLSTLTSCHNDVLSILIPLESGTIHQNMTICNDNIYVIQGYSNSLSYQSNDNHRNTNHYLRKYCTKL